MLDRRLRSLRHLGAAMAVLALAACGSAGASNDQPSGTIGGVGVLPDQDATSVAPARTSPATAAPTGSEAPAGSTSATTIGSGEPATSTSVPIAERVDGNKLLMIGDSIFAGTASRYGNEACSTLVPLNWQVQVEAESGRAIDFGARVVHQLVPSGDWDVIVFFLGTNYGGNEVGYREYLVRALDEIGFETPVVLLTTTRYAAKQDEVNTIIREEAALRPNITVLDWGALSEQPGLLSGDGYHPSTEGRQALVNAIALTVGEAPVAPGKCLQSKNRSDIPNTPGAPTTAPKGRGGSSGSGGSGGSGGSATTKPPATQPPSTGTVPPTTSETTRPPVATNPPATTQPPVTPPPATNPPQTQPPATNPPETDPPQQTSPPPTFEGP